MRQKRVLRIELSRGTGGSVYVGVSPSDCVLSIKHKLETLTGIPVLSQTLYHAATQLSDSTPLHELCGTTPVTNFALHVPIRGGATNKPTNATPGLVFHDVTNEKCFNFHKIPSVDISSIPNYRLIGNYGMTLQIRCNNKDCPSFEKSLNVYIRKGMLEKTKGCCSIRSEVSKMICTACNSKVPSCNWKNIYFASCTATIKWLLFDEVEEGETTVVLNEGERAIAIESDEKKKYAFLKVKLEKTPKNIV